MEIQSLTIIDETEELMIGHLYETAYLIKKSKGEVLLEDDFMGDIQCGIIDRNNKWAILGGTHLSLWKY